MVVDLAGDTFNYRSWYQTNTPVKNLLQGGYYNHTYLTTYIKTDNVLGLQNGNRVVLTPDGSSDTVMEAKLDAITKFKPKMIKMNDDFMFGWVHNLALLDSRSYDPHKIYKQCTVFYKSFISLKFP